MMATALPQERRQIAEESTQYEILNEIKVCHAKSLSLAAEAVAREEESNKSKAIALYLKALRHIEDGMRHEIHDSQHNGPEWDTARQMQEAMVMTLENVRQRIYQLQSFPDNSVVSPTENPPPYSLQDPLADHSRSDSPDVQLANAEPVLSIESGVQIYFVSGGNVVGSTPPSYPTFLRIVILTENYGTQGPQAIVQVGSWVYPLAKDQMPVLRSSNGAYIFPTCTTDGIQHGSAVGVVISSAVPKEYTEMFESLLRNYSVFQSEDRDDGFVDLTEFVQTTDEEEVEQMYLSDRLSKSLSNGADMVGHGIRKSSQYATELVEHGSKKITAKISPYTTPLTVNPVVRKGLLYTYEASHTTVKVSRWLVDWLCTITNKVKEQIGPFFGTQANDNTVEDSSESRSGMYKVASAGLVGFGKIWLELEKAGSAIARAVTSATVKNVEFKYGPEAGHAANLAMGAAVNIGTTAFVLDNLAIKTVAEVSAQDTEPKVVYKSSNESVTFQNSCDGKDTSRNI